MMISFKNTYNRVTLMPLVVIFIVGTVFTSCGDFLTDDPMSQITPDEAYNTVGKLKKNALLTVYNYIGGYDKSQGLQGTDRGVYDLNSLTTDEQIIPIRGGDWFDDGLWQRLYYHLWATDETPVKNTWDYLYKVVMLCNEGIERIDAFKTDKQNEQVELANYKGELRAIRAMYYFYIMDLFGRIPLVTTTNIKSSEMTLNKRSDTFYWIYNELNEALPHLPDDWSQHTSSEYYGRVTSFVAYFLMMKIALNAEIYTDDNWTDNVYPDGKKIMLKSYNHFSGETTEANAWQTVINIHDIIKGYYSLSPYYNDNFEVDNEFSKENIFVIPINPMIYRNKYEYFKRSRHYSHGAALGGGGDNGPCATLSTVKAFGYTGEEGADIDARFYSNFYFGNVIVKHEPVLEDDGITPLVYYPLAVTDSDLSGSVYQKTAGARIAKYSIDAASRDDGRLGNSDIVLFRFADALLMYAEASYRLGRTDDALNAMNAVYYRSNYMNYKSIDDDILLCERLKELMWEGWRRNDLIRFRRFHKPYDLKEGLLYHEGDAHTIVFPIPEDMMAMHPNWEQNYGYN